MPNKKVTALAVAVAVSAVVAMGSNMFSKMDDKTASVKAPVIGDGEVKSAVEPKEAKVEFKEGDHYIEIKPVYGLPSKSVVEVLWYGCSHCYNMEQFLQTDEFKEKSEAWNFQQIHFAKKDGPAGFDFGIYAALKQMGLDKTVGKEYMKAIHEGGLDRGNFEKFAEEKGLSIETVNELSKNDEAENYFKFSSQFSERDGFKGVPTFVVEGKYIINNAYNIADVANYLLEKESSLKQDPQ